MAKREFRFSKVLIVIARKEHAVVEHVQKSSV